MVIFHSVSMMLKITKGASKDRQALIREVKEGIMDLTTPTEMDLSTLTEDERKMHAFVFDDLSQWTYILTYGYSLDLYGFGALRVVIDRNTGRKVVSYVFKELGNNA